MAQDSLRSQYRFGVLSASKKRERFGRSSRQDVRHAPHEEELEEKQ